VCVRLPFDPRVGRSGVAAPESQVAEQQCPHPYDANTKPAGTLCTRRPEGGSNLGRPPPRSALHLLTGPPPHARQAAGQLTARERVELWLHLGRLLAGDGLLPAALLARVEQAGERALVGPARTRGR